MVTRIYSVGDGTDTTLVEATSQSQALRFVASAKYNVEVASPKLIATLMAKGHKVLDATKEKSDGE